MGRPGSKKTQAMEGNKKVLDSSRMMSDGTASAEEIYWAHHAPHPQYDDANNHLYGDNNADDNHDDYQPRPQQPRRPSRIRTGNTNNPNHSNNTNPIRMRIPEVRSAKTGIVLSQTSVVRDRGGGAGDTRQMQPGETVYISPSTSNKANGQYQLQPSYPSAHNNDFTTNGQNNNDNNNYNNGKGNNGGGQPQPHHYNINGAIPHYPPFLQYPQPGAAYPGYYDPHGQYAIPSNSTSDNGLNVRGEEVGIVLVVLLLWVGAIILFFNRWGKIRMLEPYQPKFCESHRPSCPMAEVTAISNHPRAFSKFNLSTEMLTANGTPHFVKCNYHGIPSADPAPGFSGLTSGGVVAGGLIIPAGFPTGGSTGMLNSQRNSMMMNHQPYYHHHHHHLSRPRQNSVFVTSPSSQVSFYGSDTTLKNSGRKTKSAVDLPTLVLTGEFIDNSRRNSKNSITQL